MEGIIVQWNPLILILKDNIRATYVDVSGNENVNIIVDLKHNIFYKGIPQRFITITDQRLVGIALQYLGIAESTEQYRKRYCEN